MRKLRYRHLLLFGLWGWMVLGCHKRQPGEGPKPYKVSYARFAHEALEVTVRFNSVGAMKLSSSLYRANLSGPGGKTRIQGTLLEKSVLERRFLIHKSYLALVGVTAKNFNKRGFKLDVQIG